MKPGMKDLRLRYDKGQKKRHGAALREFIMRLCNERQQLVIEEKDGNGELSRIA